MTTPSFRALEAVWRIVPPLAVTLSRLAHYIGLPPAPAARPVATNASQAIEEAALAGLPVVHGRPNDPMLALCGL